jgi:hypothetical protein
MDIAIVPLVIAGIFVVVFIVNIYKWFVTDSPKKSRVFGWVSLISLVLSFVAFMAALLLAQQTNDSNLRTVADQQGLTMVGTQSNDSYQLVKVDGSCTIGAEYKDGVLAVIGSNPMIQMTPALIRTICPH